MVRNDGSGEHIRHETNRKTGKKIRNKRRIKMRELVFMEEIIKSIRRIGRNDLIKNVGIRMGRRVENMMRDRRGKICIR